MMIPSVFFAIPEVLNSEYTYPERKLHAHIRSFTRASRASAGCFGSQHPQSEGFLYPGRLSRSIWTTSTWLKSARKTSEQAEAAPTLSRKWSGNLVWRIEFDESAKKELARLDRQAQVRLQRFLRERIATEEALTPAHVTL